MSKVNISGQVQYLGPYVPDEFRLVCIRGFEASDGTEVVKGSYQSFPVDSVDEDGLVILGTADAYASSDSRDRANSFVYRGELYSAGRRIAVVFKRLRIPNTPTTTTWEDIRLYSAAPATPTDPTWFDTVRAYVDSLFAPILGYFPKSLAKDYGNSIPTMISSIGSSVRTVVIDAPTTLSVDASIPTNITIRPENDATITVAAGKTLTIGSMIDPNRKVFVTPSTAKVLFTRGSVKEIRSLWWTGPYSSEIDITDVIGQMIASAQGSAGQVLDFAHGVWITEGGYTVPSRTIIKGAGWGLYNPQEETCFKSNGNADFVFKVPGNTWDIEFRDFQIDGDHNAITGVLLSDVAPNTSGNITFRRFGAGGCEIGVHYQALDNGWQIEKLSFEDVSFGDNASANIRIESPNSVLNINRAFFTLLSDQVGIDGVCMPPSLIQNVEAAGTGGSSNTTMFKFGTLPNADAVIIENYVDENITTSVEANNASDIESIIAFHGGGFGGKFVVNSSGRFAFRNTTMYSHSIVCNNDQATFAFDGLCAIKGVDSSLTPVVPSTPFDPAGTDRPIIVAWHDLKPNATFGSSVHKTMLPQRIWSPGAVEPGWADEPLVKIGVGPGTNRGLWIGATDSTPFNYLYGFHQYRDSVDGWMQWVASQGDLVNYRFDQKVKARSFIAETLTPAQFTANQNNLVLANNAGILKISTDASRDLTGLAVAFEDGEEKQIWNVGSYPLVLKHQSSSSTAANRFLNSTGGDLTLQADDIAILKYDTSINRWRVSKVLGTVVGDTDLLMQQALGSTIVAQTNPFSLVGSSASLASGTLWLSSIFIPKTTTVTGVKWYQGTQGNYTGDSYNGLGLYTYVGGTLTLVASTTNDSEIWKATANSVASKAFSSPYVAAPGIYFIGALYHSSAQTTAPTLGRMVYGPSSAAVMDFTNSAVMQGSIAGLTALPTPQAISGVTQNFNRHWFGLY